MKSECNLLLKKADFHSVERNSSAKIEERYNWVRKCENTDMNFLKDCVLLDESTFDINMKRSRAWSRKSTRAIVTLPTTRANTTSILGAISAASLITVGVKKPRPAKKRKTDGYISSGTVTSHYISFLKMTLDEMNKYPHMKGHYIVMNNAPIHTNENIKKYIEYRGYKCVYLPTYSPELTPIEQFWAVAKSKVKRYRFCKKILYQRGLWKPATTWKKVTSKILFRILTSVGINVETKNPYNGRKRLCQKPKCSDKNRQAVTYKKQIIYIYFII
jgi:transposase